MNDDAAFCRGCLGRDLVRVGERGGFGLLRCAACRTVVVDRYPSDIELAAYYQSHAKSGDYLRKKESKIRRNAIRVRRILRAGPPGTKFLDIGCNVGYMVAAASRAGLEAHGIDIDAEAVAKARQLFPGEGKHEAISIESLAARGDTFDIAYMSEVIEHVRDPDGFMAAVAKVLRPGGLLYLTAPDGAHFAVPRDFSKWGMVCPPEHLTWFSRKGMKALLARHGLKAERFQLAFKPGMKVFARKS